MAVTNQPKVPEPSMPWAREITKIINSLTEETRRLGGSAQTLNQQFGSSASATARAATVADNALERAEAPVTDADFSLDSLTIWPFMATTIPKGSFATGAIASSDLSDFSITAKKFNDNRHHIF